MILSVPIWWHVRVIEFACVGAAEPQIVVLGSDYFLRIYLRFFPSCLCRKCPLSLSTTRQSRQQNQGNPRDDRLLDSGGQRDAAQLNGTRRHAERHRRTDHAVHLPHLLRDVGGKTDALVATGGWGRHRDELHANESCIAILTCRSPHFSRRRRGPQFRTGQSPR